MSDTFFAMQSTDFDNLSIGQLVLIGAFASSVFPFCRPQFLESFRCWQSTFRKRVLRVFFFRSKPQMVRINAGRLVASGAIMQDPKTIWYRSIVHYPRGAMRVRQPSCYGDATIASGIQCAFPQPTGWSFEHEPPKSRVLLVCEMIRQMLKRLLGASRADNLIGRHNGGRSLFCLAALDGLNRRVLRLSQISV